MKAIKGNVRESIKVVLLGLMGLALVHCGGSGGGTGNWSNQKNISLDSYGTKWTGKVKFRSKNDLKELHLCGGLGSTALGVVAGALDTIDQNTQLRRDEEGKNQYECGSGYTIWVTSPAFLPQWCKDYRSRRGWSRIGEDISHGVAKGLVQDGLDSCRLIERNPYSRLYSKGDVLNGHNLIVAEPNSEDRLFYGQAYHVESRSRGQAIVVSVKMKWDADRQKSIGYAPLQILDARDARIREDCGKSRNKKHCQTYRSKPQMASVRVEAREVQDNTVEVKVYSENTGRQLFSGRFNKFGRHSY